MRVELRFRRHNINTVTFPPKFPLRKVPIQKKIHDNIVIRVAGKRFKHAVRLQKKKKMHPPEIRAFLLNQHDHISCYLRHLHVVWAERQLTDLSCTLEKSRVSQPWISTCREIGITLSVCRPMFL